MIQSAPQAGSPGAETYGAPAVTGGVRPITPGLGGVRDVHRDRAPRLRQEHRRVPRRGRDRQPLGIVRGVERDLAQRPGRRRLGVHLEHVERGRRLLLVPFRSPGAEDEQPTAIGRGREVVGIEAGEVPRADPMAVAVEDLPPARLQVLGVAGRALEHDEPRAERHDARPAGPRAGSRRPSFKRVGRVHPVDQEVIVPRADARQPIAARGEGDAVHALLAGRRAGRSPSATRGRPRPRSSARRCGPARSPATRTDASTARPTDRNSPMRPDSEATVRRNAVRPGLPRSAQVHPVLRARPDAGEVRTVAHHQQGHDGDREYAHGYMLATERRRVADEVRRHEADAAQRATPATCSARSPAPRRRPGPPRRRRRARAPGPRPGSSRPPCRPETSDRPETYDPGSRPGRPARASRPASLP